MRTAICLKTSADFKIMFKYKHFLSNYCKNKGMKLLKIRICLDWLIFARILSKCRIHREIISFKDI